MINIYNMPKNYLIAFCSGWSKGPVSYSPIYPCPIYTTQTHYMITQGYYSPILATINSMASCMAIFISYGTASMAHKIPMKLCP